MKIGRRAFVKSGVAMATVPLSTRVIAAPMFSLVLFDNASPASRRFAQRCGGPTRDVAALHTENWATFRSPLPAGTITGLTSWSDLVIARGYAEEQGRRLRHQHRQGRLFEWQIA